ncbi:uncharacterized protein LOC136065959 [Quercus suber]|uniref:uncharacterized protein LOC136065959 n=1 Tax=Quercus suber TaxID=58331 RepID=UPI0032DFC721
MGVYESFGTFLEIVVLVGYGISLVQNTKIKFQYSPFRLILCGLLCLLVVQKNLEVGELLVVDVSCIVALTTTVNVQVKYNGPMRRAVFGGDNLVTAILTGPGIVFIQSLPFHRFSQRIARAVTSPNMRENPKFFIQIAIFFFLAYVVIVSSLILTDV